METKIVTYGKKLSQIKILDTKLDIFSNGNCLEIRKENTYDKQKHYLGLKYQCVELVRRFIYLQYNINLAKKYRGNAKDWYKNSKLMNLKKIEIDNAKIGDLITFTGGEFGHIAIINNICDKNLYIISQNFKNNHEDLNLVFPILKLKNKEKFYNHLNQEYIFQGILMLRQ
jgi:uncharacterized protein YkvS